MKQSNPDWGVEKISSLVLRGPALPASPQAVAGVLHEAGYEAEGGRRGRTPTTYATLSEPVPTSCGRRICSLSCSNGRPRQVFRPRVRASPALRALVDPGTRP
jgi:hypothetical protein